MIFLKVQRLNEGSSLVFLKFKLCDIKLDKNIEYLSNVLIIPYVKKIKLKKLS